MSAALRCYEGTTEQYEEAKDSGSLRPKSFYLIDGRPYLALSESLAFTFVDTNIVTQMIASLSTGDGSDLQLGMIGGKAPTTVGTSGTSKLVAREDHTHTAQTNISGNANTATTAETARKLTSAVTIRLGGAVTGSAQFDGSDDCTITTVLQAELSGPDTWIGPESQLPANRDANTIYYVYED